MKKLFNSPSAGIMGLPKSIPSDENDIGQSAYVGKLFVRACDLFERGTPVKKGAFVSLRPGVKIQAGEKVFSEKELGKRKVVNVMFSSNAESTGPDSLGIVGWIAVIEGFTHAVKCESLVLE